MIRPSPWPRSPFDTENAPGQIRGQFNQVAKAISGQQTLLVTTSAIAIFDKITNTAAGWVSGDDGSGNIFADQVAWNGTTNTKLVVSTGTVAGSPAARTYTVVSGVLKVTMASGTYTVVCVPVVFTT